MSLNSFYGNTFFSDSKTCLSQFESHIFFCTNHESDGSLLVDVDGDVGALDPGVGAQVSQSYVRVSGRQTAHFSFTSALFLISLLLYFYDYHVSLVVFSFYLMKTELDFILYLSQMKF